jgi:ribosome biogenesis ATPase
MNRSLMGLYSARAPEGEGHANSKEQQQQQPPTQGAGEDARAFAPPHLIAAAAARAAAAAKEQQRSPTGLDSRAASAAAPLADAEMAGAHDEAALRAMPASTSAHAGSEGIQAANTATPKHPLRGSGRSSPTKRGSGQGAPPSTGAGRSTGKRARAGGVGGGSFAGGPPPSSVSAPMAITYADLGGIEPVLEAIKELVEFPLKHPEVYEWLGVEPPRGILLHGPPGCGKTALANAIAAECGVPFLRVAAPEIVSGMSGESEAKIRQLFQEAAAVAPCIVFIGV